MVRNIPAMYRSDGALKDYFDRAPGMSQTVWVGNQKVQFENDKKIHLTIFWDILGMVLHNREP